METVLFFHSSAWLLMINKHQNYTDDFVVWTCSRCRYILVRVIDTRSSSDAGIDNLDRADQRKTMGLFSGDLFPTKLSFVIFISYMGLFINQGKLVSIMTLYSDAHIILRQSYLLEKSFNVIELISQESGPETYKKISANLCKIANCEYWQINFILQHDTVISSPHMRNNQLHHSAVVLSSGDMKSYFSAKMF